MSKGPVIPIGQILDAPDYTQGVVLTTGSSNAQAFDNPIAGGGYVNLAFNTDVWVKYGSTACVIPSSTTTAGSSTPELNPTMRNIHSPLACTGISLAAEIAGKGVISWYKAA